MAQLVLGSPPTVCVRKLFDQRYSTDPPPPHLYTLHPPIALNQWKTLSRVRTYRVDQRAGILTVGRGAHDRLRREPDACPKHSAIYAVDIILSPLILSTIRCRCSGHDRTCF